MSEEQYLSTDDSDWEYNRLSVDSESNSIDADSVETKYRILSGDKIVEKQSAVVEDDMKRRTCWVDLRTEGKWKVFNNCLMWECKKCKPRTSYSSLADFICHTVKDHQKTLTFQCNTCCEVLEDNALAEHFASHSEISASLYDAIKEENDTETEDMTNENVDEEPIESEYSCDQQFKDEESDGDIPLDVFEYVSEDILLKFKTAQETLSDDVDFTIKCEHCTESFKTIARFAQHMKNYHHDKVLPEKTKKKYSCRKKSKLENCEMTTIKTEPVICSICAKEYASKKYLRIHMKTRHEPDRKKKTRNVDKLHLCSICGKSFDTVRKLREHCRTHTGEKPFACSICDKAFSSKNNMVRHTMIHTGEKPFECDICKKSFNQKSTLIQHSQMHTLTDQYQCDKCGKRFPGESHLEKHRWSCHSGVRKRLPDPRFTCEICNKPNSSEAALRSHTLSHTRPFLCEMCPKSFATKLNLRTHVMLHTGERPYACEFCSRSFRSQINLRSHLRVHTGERPYKCSVCERPFAQLTNLKRHEEIHTDIRTKPFTCQLCDKSYQQRAALTDHMNGHTGARPYQCQYCPGVFQTHSSLQKHTAKHVVTGPEDKDYKAWYNYIV